MIKVSKFNKKEFFLNPSMIETIEKTPDTVITLINGKKYVVAEKLDEVLKLIEDFYKDIGITTPQVIFKIFKPYDGDEESNEK